MDDIRKKKYLATLSDPVEKPSTYSGDINLRHGRTEFKKSWEDANGTRSVPELKSFSPSGTEPSNYGAYGGYDGDGGVFGGKGVYLDNSGIWTNPPEGMRWGVDSVYDVSGKFNNAKVLTPENIYKYTHDISPQYYAKDKVLGNDIVDKAIREGHDALVMQGFDKDYRDFMKGTDYDFYNEANLPQEEHDKLFERRAERANRYSAPYEEAKLDSSIAQDQVISFEPEKLNVKKSDGKTPYEFTDFTPKQSFGAKFTAELVPLLAHYANEYSHNEFNPLNIKSLNEGEDEKMQQINALNKQKYLESLGRGPSSESDWYSAMDTMSSEAYKTNPNLFRPTYIGSESGYSYISPQSSAADYNVIAPALQKVYGTPENYMIEGYKNLEQEAKNPGDYSPAAVSRNKKALLDQLYPQIKS